MGYKKEIEAFFDKDSHDYVKFKYKTGRRTYMSVRHAKMLEVIEEHVLLKNCENHLALDAGCGPGMFLGDLMNLGFKVIGVDMSEGMLKTARESLESCGKSHESGIVRGDIEGLPFKDSTFNLVCSAGVIEYLKGDGIALSEFRRVLADGGYLLVSVTNKYAYNLIFDHILETTKRCRFAFSLLERVKSNLLGLGSIKQRDFVIRKHSPFKFRAEIERQNFRIVHSRFFFFNLFPHPFNLFVPRINDHFANKWENIEIARRAFWGEGYMVLCQKL